MSRSEDQPREKLEPDPPVARAARPLHRVERVFRRIAEYRYEVDLDLAPGSVSA